MDGQQLSTTAGSKIELRLVNGTSERYGFNLCLAELQKSDGSAVEEGDSPAEPSYCTTGLSFLEPGESSSADKLLSATLEPGSYRYTLELERDPNERLNIKTPLFEVTQ
ncbi:MAG TPA: hypothetical protein VEY30_05725 [Myxococcaceae bacterium]|nr:hypothetical protein [Myxococcaceae bacterium]